MPFNIIKKNNVDKGNCRFTIFTIYGSYKSHLSYRMSENVKILSGPFELFFDVATKLDTSVCNVQNILMFSV
jgi:hypothetical protein